jgi:hypothetical protein
MSVLELSSSFRHPIDRIPNADRSSSNFENRLGCCFAIGPMASLPTYVASSGLAARRIASTGEAMPIVRLGSWITFNVGRDPKLLDDSAAVIAAFLDGGGRMIDSSPMYGSS